MDITFQFADKQADPLDREVTATMTLRDVKLINAIIGPTSSRNLTELLANLHADQESEFVDTHGKRLYTLYESTKGLLEVVGEDF